MTTYDAGSVKASADLDRDPFIEGLRQLRREGEQFARQRYTATADVDIKLAERNIAAIREQLRRLAEQSPTIRPDVDITGALAQLEALRRAQAGLGGTPGSGGPVGPAGGPSAAAREANTRAQADLRAAQAALARARAEQELARTETDRARANASAAAAVERNRIAQARLDLQAQANADRAAEAAARNALAQRRLDEARTRSATASTRANEKETKQLGLMRVAIEQLAPPIVPVAGGLLAMAGSAAELGIAGVLAFKGIQNAIKDGTPAGIAYAGMLGGVKADLKTLETTAAHGFLPGFEQGVAKLHQGLPAFNADIQQSSQILGAIGSHVIGGLVGGFETFSGVIHTGEVYLDRLAARFEAWATGPGGASFAKTLGTDLDHLIPALGQIATLAVHLVSAFNPIGTVMLDDLGMLAKTLNEIPVGVLQAGAAAYLTFRTVVSVTKGLDLATASLRALAGAEAAAAAGAGAGAGGAARGGMLSRGIGLAGRALPWIAGLYMGGTMLKGMSANGGDYNTPRNDMAGTTAAFTHGTGQLLTGNFGGAYSDWFGAHRQQQVAAGNQYQSDVRGDMIFGSAGQDPKLAEALNNITKIFGGKGTEISSSNQHGGYDSQGNLVVQPGGPMARQTGIYGRPRDTLQNQMYTARDSAYNAMIGPTDMSSTLMRQEQQRSSDPAAAAAGYDKLNAALQKTVTTQSKWLDQGGHTVLTYKGMAIGEKTYQAAMAASNNDRAKAHGLIEATVDALGHNKTALEVNGERQQRLNDDVAAAMSKYSITGDQVAMYTKFLGLNADELGRGQVSQYQFVHAIGEVKKAVDNGDSSITQITTDFAAFSQGVDNAASRGALIGSVLKAANGDAISFGQTMVGAAVANQQLVTDLGKTAKGVINLRTGFINYHNAGAAPVLNDLAALQDANVKAAAAVYQHEVKQRGGTAAAKDAFDMYRNNTQRALIDEAQKLGMNAEQAKRFADRYLGIKNAGDLKKQIELIGADKTNRVMGAILEDLDAFTGHKHNAALYFNDGGAQTDLQNIQTLIGSIQGVHTVRITYIDPKNGPGTRDKGGTAEADGGVLDFYANGGMREHHVAQIAPAGAWRVWAEPETGGEAYIPLAPAKRQRSQQIATQTVERLGGVAYFANGGEHGGYQDVNYGNGKVGSGGSGKGTHNNPIKSKKGGPKLYKYRGLWYEGYDAYLDAKADYESSKSPGRIIDEPGTHGYSVGGQNYDKHYQALNAREEWRRTAVAAAGGNMHGLEGNSLNLPASHVGLWKLGKRGSAAIGGAADAALSHVQAANAAGALSDPWTKAMESDVKHLHTALTARDKAVDVYKAQQARVKSLQDAAKQDAAGVRDTVLGGFDIGTSGNGYAQGITSSLDKQIKDAAKFEKLRQQAKKLGLDPKLLAQITREGPTVGGANLEAIVKGGKGYVEDLDKKYKKLEDIANKTGKDQADDDYRKKILAAQAKEKVDRTAMLAAQKTSNRYLARVADDIHNTDRRLLEFLRQHGKG